MVARHALVRPPIRVRLRPVLTVAADVAEVLWLVVCAAFWSGVAAVVFGLLAFGFAENGQWAAGVMTIGVGFALIVFVLIEWTRRQNMKPPQQNYDGHQWDDAGKVAGPETGCCPFCGGDEVPLTVRITGNPRPDVVTILDRHPVDVCGDCAPTAVLQAVKEHDFSRAMVRVEPIKAVAG